MTRAAGAGPPAIRLRALIIVLWRAGLRISEALALAETDLDPSRGGPCGPAAIRQLRRIALSAGVRRRQHPIIHDVHERPAPMVRVGPTLPG